MRLVTLLLTSLTLLISGTASADVNIKPGEYVVFYHHDVLGSPVTATNELGQVIWHERTESYGKSEGRVSQDGTAFGDNALPAGNSRQGYTGHTLDNSAGLTYMKARYYDHHIGRFLSNDPVGFYEGRPTSFNRYAYSGNNPYRYVDPNGKDFLDAYKNPATAMAVATWGARLGSRSAKTPWTAAAAAAFASTAAATGYGLHKLSVLLSEGKEDIRDEDSHTEAGEGTEAEDNTPSPVHSPDQRALNDLINGETNGARKPLSNIDADTIIEWAEELGIEGVRDDRGKNHWDGGEHIHVPGSGHNHIPTE